MAQDPSDEDRIRHKAHEIWESEGRPHGRDQHHWVEAREIIALQDSMGETLLPQQTGAEEPVEPAEAVTNLGDVPNLTDQGEHDLTDTDREPEVTKPSHATYALGDTAGGVARPAQTATPDMDEPETVTPPPEVAAVIPTFSNPTLGEPAPRTSEAKPGLERPAPAASPVGNSAPVTAKAQPKSTPKSMSVTKSGKPSGKR